MQVGAAPILLKYCAMMAATSDLPTPPLPWSVKCAAQGAVELFNAMVSGLTRDRPFSGWPFLRTESRHAFSGLPVLGPARPARALAPRSAAGLRRAIPKSSGLGRQAEDWA